MSDPIDREITSGELKVELAAKLRLKESEEHKLLKLVQTHGPMLKKHMSDESLSEVQKENPHRDFVKLLVKLTREAPDTEAALTAKLLISNLLSYCMMDEEERGTGRDRKMHRRRFLFMKEIRQQHPESWQAVYAEVQLAAIQQIPVDGSIRPVDMNTVLKELLKRNFGKYHMPPAEVLDLLKLDSSASEPLRVLILHWIFANEYNQATNPIAQDNGVSGAVTLKAPFLDQAGLERAKVYGEQIIREFPDSQTGEQVRHLLKYTIEPMLQDISDKK